MILRTIFLLSIFFAGCNNFFAQSQNPKYEIETDKLEISLQEKSNLVKKVRSILVGKQYYICVDDIAAFTSTRTYINPTLKKMEVLYPSVTIKITAENSFVIITNTKSKKQNITQIPLPFKFVEQKFFAPLPYFISLLDDVAGLQFSVNAPILIKEPPPVTTDAEGKNITGVSIEEKANGYLLRIHALQKFTDVVQSMQNTDKWLYVTIPNGKANVAKLNKLKFTGVVKKLIAVQSPLSLQLSFRVDKKITSTELVSNTNSNDVIVILPTLERIPSSVTIPEEKKLPDINLDIDKERKKWKLDVVVIDAGHGGKDPGSIGNLGTREKDITLGVALKLGELIEEKLPDIKVVYTRKTDKFIELYRRGQIANEAGGKLFISIHCNSTEQKPTNANGYEIYLLRPGKTEAAIRVAEKENSVVKLEKDYEERYQKLTEENFILLTMAQSAYVKQSELFAGFLNIEMDKKLPLNSRGVKQAGFYVLVGASMPNVLIETAYISNLNDEKFLRSFTGQKLLAESIFNGLKKFKEEYEKTLLEN